MCFLASLTKALTLFAACAIWRICVVSKLIPGSSMACLNRCRASRYLEQVLRKWSTVSGSAQLSHSPSACSPIRKRWWLSWQCPVLNRKIVECWVLFTREGFDRVGKWLCRHCPSCQFYSDFPTFWNNVRKWREGYRTNSTEFLHVCRERHGVFELKVLL